MGIHKVYVEWHDLTENPNDVPATDDPVYVIVENNDAKYVDVLSFRCSNGAWEVAVPPSEDDLCPEEYEPISAYPNLKIIAWCKPILPIY